jgi:hypothetical protein
VLCRFVAGGRNINLTTADRLAAVLRLRLADDPAGNSPSWDA